MGRKKDPNRPRKPKLSGAQYRKLRKARESQIRIDALLNGETVEDENSPISSEEDQLPLCEYAENENIDNLQSTEYVCGRDDFGNPVSISSDPGLWDSCITFKMRDILVMNGPVQIKEYTFPTNECGRRFSSLHYQYQLLNGEIVNRKWLIYSKFKDSIYCFCCKLFSQSRLGEGFRNWQNLSHTLMIHERTKIHVNAFQKWMELHSFLKKSQVLNVDYQHTIQQQKENLKKLIDRFLAIIQFLAIQGLPFQQISTQSLSKKKDIRGNFTHIVDLFKKFDPYVKKYLNNITNGGFTWSQSKNDSVRNELLSIFSSKIKNHIIDLVKEARYYSVIVTSLLDRNNREHFALILRIVTKQFETQKFAPCEYFIGFISPSKMTEIALAKQVLNELKNCDLSLQHLRGQGYNFMAFMKATQYGFQNDVFRITRRAFCVPSACHSLNLFVYDSLAFTGKTMIVFFSCIQRLFKFFTTSKTIVDRLEKLVLNVSFKNVSFEPYDLEIVVIVRNFLPEIIEILLEIGESVENNFLRFEAIGLIKSLYKYDFICGIIVWHEILLKVNGVSELFQSEKLNLPESIEKLNDVIQYFKFHQNIGFVKVAQEASVMCNELEMDTDFSASEINSGTDLFNNALIVTIKSLEDKHSQILKYCNVFGFLHNIQNLKKNDVNLKRNCLHMEKALKYQNLSDIDGTDLHSEIKVVLSLLKSNMTALDILNYIHDNDLSSLFPNVAIALRIFLTLPMTSITDDISKSKLEVIKMYLQSTTSENLNEMAILSIENNLVNSIKLSDITDAFIASKCTLDT